MFKKTLSLSVIICFFLTTLGSLPKAHADNILGLPAPGTMVNLSPVYQPVIIKGLTVHKDNPFLFDFIVDVGQDKMSGAPLKKEGEKLIKYFLASLAIPDKDVWVNLSPYEKNRMIPESLGQTDMGRDLLEQDYILKQITASLIYPEKQLGKTFWNEVYAKAREQYGTTNIPVNTFNKVWITADKASVFEHNQTAFVVASHLKVMLEEDYLALQKHSFKNTSSPNVLAGDPNATNTPHQIASQIVKQIILPQLEHEVNTGKNFANLRQIFNSIILASWYKRNLKEALLNQVYADKSKVNGVIASGAKQSREEIYEQYLKAYKKGVFNYIKEDINAANGEIMPRKYFSGGMAPGMATDPERDSNPADLDAAMTQDPLVDFATLASTQRNPDAAMAGLRAMFLSAGLRAHKKIVASNELVKATSDYRIAFSNYIASRGSENDEDYHERYVASLQQLAGVLFNLQYDGIEIEKYIIQEGQEVIAEHPLRVDERNEMGGDLLKQTKFGIKKASNAAMTADVDWMTTVGDRTNIGWFKELTDQESEEQEARRARGEFKLQSNRNVYSASGSFAVGLKSKSSISSNGDVVFVIYVAPTADQNSEHVYGFYKGHVRINLRDRKVTSWSGLWIPQNRLEQFPWLAEFIEAKLASLVNKTLLDAAMWTAQVEGATVRQIRRARNPQQVYDVVNAIYYNGSFVIKKAVREKITALRREAARQVKTSKVKLVQPPGGIDLNTSNGMQWKISKDGNGVEMTVDPALIARVRREGIDSLSLRVLRVTPVASIWPLVGFQAPGVRRL